MWKKVSLSLTTDVPHVIEIQFESFIELANRWKTNQAEQAKIPKEYFSKTDLEKIDSLSKQFSGNVGKFGYRSTDVSSLHISNDNYRPVSEDFEVAFGASASDNIRLIWAYTLALLQVSSRLGGNHWGVITFDEPEQQQMKEADSTALYGELAKMTQDDFQVIIATSAPKDLTEDRLESLPHTLIEFGDKVIRPVER